MINNKNKIKIILKTIKNNSDGFTLKYTTLKPYSLNKGYAVSITHIESKKPLVAIKRVLNCIQGFKHIQKNLFIGGWLNPENKKLCLDLSFILEDKTQIEIIGFLFKQIAYFNFSDFTTINFKEVNK